MARWNNDQLSELCISAFHSEYYGRYEEAVQRHIQAIEDLHKIANTTTTFDPDRRRLAIKQIKFHTARVQILDGLTNSGRTEIAVVLPTSISVQEDLTTLRPNGNCCLSYEEFFLAKWGEQRSGTPPSRMAHLFQPQIPFFAPTLDPLAPVTSYNIFVSKDYISPDQTAYYIAAKSSAETGNQTLYVLQAVKERREQISEARLHRSTEITSPCVQVIISPVKPDRDAILTSEKGRTMQFNTTWPRPIIEVPDREDRRGWSNRRFTLAGRNFVWMTEGRNEASFNTCWETESVRAKPGSRTGKKEHTLLPNKLCWGTTTGVRDVMRKKMGVVYMIGGLDQMFQEYLLASQLARFMVIVYGHGN